MAVETLERSTMSGLVIQRKGSAGWNAFEHLASGTSVDYALALLERLLVTDPSIGEFRLVEYVTEIKRTMEGIEL